MKHRRSYALISALLVLGGCCLAMADNQKSLDIDQQIQKIESAPPAQRYKLMNRFKMQLATMNKEERIRAIEALRNRMHGTAKSQGEGMERHGQMQDHPDHIDFHQHNQMIHQGINEKMGQREGMQEALQHRLGNPFKSGDRGGQKGVNHAATSMSGSQDFNHPSSMGAQTPDRGANENRSHVGGRSDVQAFAPASSSRR